MSALEDLIAERIQNQKGSDYYNRRVPPDTLRWLIDQALLRLAEMAVPDEPSPPPAKPEKCEP